MEPMFEGVNIVDVNGNNFNECMQITGGQMLVRDISSSVPIDPLVPMTCCTGLQSQLIERENIFLTDQWKKKLMETKFISRKYIFI